MKKTIIKPECEIDFEGDLSDEEKPKINLFSKKSIS